MSKTKTVKKSTAPTAAKIAKAKAAPAKKAPAAKTLNATPPVESTPVADPCAAGHQWDTDGDGEFCTVCKSDRKVIETAEKKQGAAKPAKEKKETKDKKLSAIDAAAQLLAAAKEPMGCLELVEAMAAKGLWTSPGGKTPHATLYSAIVREIATKGKDSRFTKADRGRFTINA